MVAERVLAFLQANPGMYPVEVLERKVRVASKELSAVLEPMQGQGRIVRSLSGKIGLPGEVRRGTISAHPKGFGFVTDEAGAEYFVSPPQMGMLISGDVVSFAPVASPRDGRVQAEVLAVVHRPESHWLGEAHWQDGQWRFVPDGALFPEVRLAPSSLPLSEGEVVQVRISSGVTGPAVPGHIVKTLGMRGRPGFDTDYAIAAWGVPAEFSAAALRQAEKLGDAVTAADRQGRRDLTALPFVTIDGETTRDFDDAVYAERRGSDFRLWVAIADVSHYVKDGDPLDVEARSRGNSVYFPERVIPMLPERLSNGLCSLNPGEDRCCMVCEMVVGEDGKIRAYAFYPALMRSQARLTYTAVADALLNPESTACVPFRAQLMILRALHEVLRSKRQARGVLDFASREPRLVVREGKITDIVWLEGTVAHRIVEECMLTANQCAAKFLWQHARSRLFRHHAPPEGDAWEEARAVLARYGVSMPQEASLKSFQATLEACRSREAYPIVEEALRSAMAPAVYDPNNPGHFSLGYEAYTHFTSPIRRYPDLLVHRAIRAVLGGEQAPVFDEETVAAHCSETGWRADRACRYVWTLLKRRHLSRFVGEKFGCKVVLHNKRGAKVVLLEWETAGWLPAEELMALGWEYDEDSKTWQRDTQVLDAGTQLVLRLTAASDDELVLEALAPGECPA